MFRLMVWADVRGAKPWKDHPMPENGYEKKRVRDYAKAHGLTYQQAHQALTGERERRPVVFAAGLTQDGRPWVSSWDGDPHHDVNPACGHHLRALCGGCGVCTTCDGCYCAELAQNAALDAEAEREMREHLEHDEHRADCWRCEREREESADYTRCPKCGLAYPDGIGDHHRHNPPYCRPLPTYRVGIDWGYLRGQHVTLVGTHYNITGYVLPDQDAPDPTAYHPYMQLRRTDPGYEGEVAPFCPRDWLEVHPAPVQ
ncbi:hypothetical protein SAMN05421811_127167 [Nonomuraea wenchangensis]|uniref:Uncharacterized protein n=2 Tax=Nonomuraea wenchangensis TaxID=568860 RepID=A0A1I0LUB2_9ACTN|nr:hypothetical protein SAMN05421811_127167 [Nonomuraea wenchangensis]